MKTINIRNVGRDDLEHLLELNQPNLPQSEKSQSLHASIICDRKTKSPGNSTADTDLKRSAPRKPKTAKRTSRFKSSLSNQWQRLFHDRVKE